MAVRPDDEIAGLDEALFGQERVFHARAAAFVVMGDAHFPGKATGHDHLIGRGDILLGGVVIHHQKHAILVEHLLCAHGAEGFNGQRAGDVVGEHAGKRTFHDLTRFADLFVGVHLKYFLGKRHCHDSISRKKYDLRFAPAGKRALSLRGGGGAMLCALYAEASRGRARGSLRQNAGSANPRPAPNHRCGALRNDRPRA